MDSRRPRPDAAPQVVAVIPARGGSKGVPGKNLRRVAGRALIERAVDACRGADRVDAVFVSTDDPAIAAAATSAGAGVLVRPPALAGDTASSESALLDALEQLGERGQAPDVLVFCQCTSPFVDPADLDRAVALVRGGEAEAVFAAVTTHAFLWRGDASPGTGPGLVGGLNHDPAYRPRRQDTTPDYRETGAFYVVDVPCFVATGRRFCGRIAPVLVAELGAIDVDTEHDLMLAQAVAPLIKPAPVAGVDVDAVITDFDGVHTDDTATVDAAGIETVRVSRGDGLGVARLRAAGVPMLIVSTETNPVVSARAAKLNVEVVQGVSEKTAVVRDWLAARSIPHERVAYLGNDVNDLAPMGGVGWPVATADARPEVRAAARLVLTRPGGRGAVRELCDLVLASRGGDATGLGRRVVAATPGPAGPGVAAGVPEHSIDHVQGAGRAPGRRAAPAERR